MNPKNKTIAIIIIVIIVLAGGYSYFTNANFKNSANEFVANNITGKESPPAVVKTVYQHWIYFIADGTGDCYIKYSIPVLGVDHLTRAADSIHKHNGGKLWLSYFDNDSKNNLCVYLSVPSSLVKQAKPEVISGETSFEASDKLKAWEAKTANFSNDSLANEAHYQKQKEKFLKECELVLTQKVYVKGLKENLWSDIIGGLNSSFRTFNAISDKTPAYKYVVAFSDLQNDAPYLKPKPHLENMPDGVKLIAVNPAPGSSKKCTHDVIELEAPERVYETIFNHQ
jgi:hypothetical protein